MMCLLSLVFGGLLWPIAMLWAYIKPMGMRIAVVEPSTCTRLCRALERPGLRSRTRRPPGRPADGSADSRRYAFIVWLIFFKFKLLPWNTTSQVIVVTIPVVGMFTLIMLLNRFAPSSPTYG